MTDSQLKFNLTDNFFGGSDEIVSNITNIYLGTLGKLRENGSLGFNETTTTEAIERLPACWFQGNPHFDCNKSAYVEAYRGPQQLPIITALAVSI